MKAVERHVDGNHRSTDELAQYDDYTAYKCLYCNEECINKIRSVPTRANLCRKCLQNPAAFNHGKLPPEEFEHRTEDYDA